MALCMPLRSARILAQPPENVKCLTLAQTSARFVPRSRLLYSILDVMPLLPQFFKRWDAFYDR